jgi:hypothetical protein
LLLPACALRVPLVELRLRPLGQLARSPSVRQNLLGACSRSARSAFVSFFFAIVPSDESFDTRQGDRNVAHV